MNPAVFAAFVISLGLFQYRIDPVRGAESAQRLSVAQTVHAVQDGKTNVQEQRRDFEKRFNLLVTAMAEFQKEYNASSGEVWPKKKAEALKKAIDELRIH